nr:ThiF family adenylyltransferase [Bacillus marinisedimentorum]
MSQWERYSRQMLFKPIGEDGQRNLADAKVLIVGMGALGTAAANHLARAGVGFIRFADRDYVEKSNLQRQMLFDEEDVKAAMPKAEAARRKLMLLNSDIMLDARIGDVNADNVEELIAGIDLVIDGTDNFSTRFLLNDACFKHGIPFIYGGAVSSRGMFAALRPGKTPCLRCLMPEQQGGQTCDTVGVISPVVDMVSSYQVTETLKYLTGNEKHMRSGLLNFDIWYNQQFQISFGKSRSDCPVCSKKSYPALEPTEKETTTVLCGRETVQIQNHTNMDLNDWAERLAPVAQLKKTPFLLRAELNEGERLVLFPDGRVLVQGTEDITRAKTLYSRYIGL